MHDQLDAPVLGVFHPTPHVAKIYAVVHPFYHAGQGHFALSKESVGHASVGFTGEALAAAVTRASDPQLQRRVEIANTALENAVAYNIGRAGNLALIVE